MGSWKKKATEPFNGRGMNFLKRRRQSDHTQEESLGARHHIRNHPHGLHSRPSGAGRIVHNKGETERQGDGNVERHLFFIHPRASNSEKNSSTSMSDSASSAPCPPPSIPSTGPTTPGGGASRGAGGRFVFTPKDPVSLRSIEASPKRCHRNVCDVIVAL